MSTNTRSLEATRAANVRRGRWLEYLIIGWNSLGGLIAIGTGFVAGSIPLMGLGIHSVIKVSSGAELLWRLHLDAPERRERAEQIVLKLIGAQASCSCQPTLA